MKIEVNKNELAGALTALGKLICRTSPNGVFKALQIMGNKNKITFRTCNQEETILFSMNAVLEGDFLTVVDFEQFRVAVRNCKNKVLSMEFMEGLLSVDGTVIEGVPCDYPALEFVPEQCQSSILPENFVELLTLAAPVVNRSDYRKVLQGINLSKDGITATNGKELFNVASALEVDSLTIPFPLALMSTKSSGPARLFYWSNGNETLFRISLKDWVWQGKALHGIYPNWKQILPKENTLEHSVKFSVESAKEMMSFLKQLPDDPPNNAVELSVANRESLRVRCLKDSAQQEFAAEFPDDWGTFVLPVNRNILLRLLSEGHTTLKCSESHAPMMAFGGVGQYLAMPLYRHEAKKEETSSHNETINLNEKEKEKMIEANTTIVPAPMQRIALNEAEMNPMEELTATIESFKMKLKVIFEESSMLSRKVKEVQLAQKQKERDFILAKKAIERIRMVSSF